MSQAQLILADLKDGQHITQLDALRDYGCFRLGARIYDLKQEGHKIATTMQELPSGKHVASYSLIGG